MKFLGAVLLTNKRLAKRVHWWLKGSELTLCGKRFAGKMWTPVLNGGVPVCGQCLKQKNKLEDTSDGR